MAPRVRLGVLIGVLALVVVGLGGALLGSEEAEPVAASPVPSGATTPEELPPASASPSPTPSPTRTPMRTPAPTRTPTPTPTTGPTRTEAPTASAKPTPTSRPTRSTPPPARTSTNEARQVLALTNAERADAGCEPLAWDARLATAAAGHSVDMATHDYFSHTSRDGRSVADRVTAAGYGWSRVAENIAAGQPSPEAVVASWMGSEGHRRNILDCRLTELGVGVARSAATGNRPHWTQDFGTPR